MAGTSTAVPQRPAAAVAVPMVAVPVVAVPMERDRYLPEVNGLRALAVLAVIAYHLDLAVVPGGFLGVDAFFTISGFVITRSIFGGMDRGTFSLPRFYYARLRRLFPALLVTVAATVLVAIALFPPAALVRTSLQSLAALASVSNILFWSQDDYFSPAASSSPFLHTWSLGVEEQFYLFWPLFLLLLFRLAPRFVPLAMAALFLIGLAIADVTVRTYPVTAFYWMPFRIFEFAAGGFIATWRPEVRPRGWKAEAVMAGGLAVLVASFLVYGESTPVPGLQTLVPVLAVAAVIRAGHARYVDVLLTNPVSAALGRASYSLYLVHWPIVVFWKWIADRPLTILDMVAAAAVTLFAGLLLHVLVERRFRYHDFLRRHGGGRLAPAGFAALLVVVGATSGAAWGQGGWVWRSAHYLPEGFLREQMQHRYANLPKVCNLGNGLHCLTPPPADRERVLVIGDSHATDGLNILLPSLSNQYIVIDEIPGCPPFEPASPLWNLPNIKPACVAGNARRFDPAFVRNFDLIVLSVFWSWYQASDADPFLTLIQKAAPEAKIIVLDNYIELKELCSDRLERYGLDSCFVPDNIRSRFRYEDDLRALAERHGALFLSKRDLLCKGDDCAFYADEAHRIPFTWDAHHLSLEFAEMIGERAKPLLQASISRNANRLAGTASP